MRQNFPPGPPAPRNPIDTARYFRKITSDPFGVVSARFQRYGDIYRAEVRGQNLFVIKHPDHIDEVLLSNAKHFDKTTTGFAAKRLHKLLGNGLVNANGEAWRRHRRMINPALSRRKIASYGPTIVDYTSRMVDRWLTGQVVDVASEMMELTLRIVTKVLFDHDAGESVETVQWAMQAFRNSSGIGVIFPDWVPWKPNRDFDAALEAVDEIIYGMIAERRRLSDDELAARDDLLSALVLATDDGDDGRLSTKELRDELLTLFFAGHETTSNGIAWTLYLLSQHPEALAWVTEELETLDGPPTVDDLDNLPRTRAAFEEGMRLRPPVCVISRTATADVTIDDWDVPAGSEVLVWFYWTHRDERWFDDPLAFRPERFVGDRTWPRNAYMPFGAGQRICIGKHFALMEATLILAEVLRRRTLEYADPEPPVPELAVTLAPRDGLRMRVQ